MQFMHNLSIRQKLLILIVFTSLFIGIVGLIGSKYLQESTARMDEMYTYRLIPVKDLNVVRIHNKTIESNMFQLMVETDKAKSAEIIKNIESLDQEVQTILKQLKDRIPEGDYKKLQEDMVKFSDQRGSIIYNASTGKVQAAISILHTFSSMLNTVNDDLSKLADRNAALAEESNANNRKEAQTAYAYLLGSLIICILLSLTMGLLISNNIVNPIRKVVHIAKQVAQGDLRVKQLNMTGKSEIGQLAASIDEMVAHLKELITDVHKSAGQVAESANELMIGSEHTSKASEAAATAVQDIHEGFQKQLHSIHETSRAMEDMTSGIQQIASGSEDAAGASSSAYEKANNGRTVISNAVATIEHLASAVHDSSARISLLGEKTNEITEVIKLISDLASQTNLLSLNAAIEAARAGEHGRGFGVVAGEVKKLAEQSRLSAYKVSEIVEEIQQETMELVNQISSSVQQAEQGLEAAHQAGKAFEGIANEVEIVSQQIVSVSATVEQLSAGSQQILATSHSLLGIAQASASNTENISATTEETLASMEEVRNSSAVLSKLASELDELISKFIIAEQT
ncbi:methyl-accepting chemotaxis protein [Paenibacillus sp. GP183]|uniref:methyl-accepting chemotaxis protein n=1 Tax=Paenibacillus sp. GP183 TaxID=1882751 RepID=UPI00089AB090|nr:methyl-accepting chemotaxis protein [Paenibacillus sp. GP183]SEC55560.1 methyl-accepting chemotaxis sensory transducer [Paenibacillus sp. GP183]